MARHSHQQLMRLLRNQPRSAETTPHSASSTTKLQYSMMTQRRRQRLNRVRTTLPSHDQLQKRVVLSAHRTTDVNTRDSNIFNGRRFDGHLCDTSLVDTSFVIKPLSETLQQRRRNATVRRTSVSARATALRSPGTDQFVTL